MAKKLLVFLSILVVCVTVFVACGGPAETTAPDTTTSKDGTTTTTPEATTTEEITTTPEVTTTIDPETIEDPVERYKYITDAVWCGNIHAGVVYGERADKDNPSVKHNAFRFGYASDNGIFGNDPDTAIPGIQLTAPDRVYIREAVDGAEYTQYEIEYYEVPNWWEVWFVAKDFVPEDGKSYLITLFIQSDDNLAHTFPESVLFWETYPDEPWTYEAPAPVQSNYGDILEMVPDIKDRTQLFLHDSVTVTAEGHLRYGFKSDNNPFADPPAGADGTQIYGLSFTRPGKVFINGEAYEIENYTTIDWWVIEFDIKNFTPVEGTEYEIIFTVDSSDDTGDYCKNGLGYFTLNTAVLLAAPAV